MSWNNVKGYEGLYEVSDDGRIRSLDRHYTDSIGRDVVRHGHILKPTISGCGYERITLVKDGESKTYPVHRLVANAFINNPQNYSFINHKDENKLNNNVSNLEWCTAKYNANYGTRNIRMRETLRRLNINCHALIATTKDGKKEYYDSARDAERELGYPHSGISNALKGRAHTACERTWEYAEV